MMKPDDKVTVVKMKGLHHVDTIPTDATTYLTPEAKPGTFGCESYLCLCLEMK